MLPADVQKFFAAPETSIRDVMKIIDANKNGIAVVVGPVGVLLGTITDGDIRRFILTGGSLDEPCNHIMKKNPVTAPLGTASDALQDLMRRFRVRTIPVVDQTGCVKDFGVLDELMTGERPGQVAVIMAGGEGKRLWPITENIPKPMVDVGGKPILETIVANLAGAGITRLYIAVNYRAEVIEDYFGDGSRFNVNITYVREGKKLGTAGALSLLQEVPTEPLLLMNGDVLTEVNFDRLLEFHRHHRCVMSLSVMDYNITIPFGVATLAGHFVVGMEEKPTKKFFCNAGIYVINPEILRFLPYNEKYDITELLEDVLREGLPIGAFPIHEYWVDVGMKNDLNRAREDIESKKSSEK
ncbi:MAG TPA: nucleotidyltransferase family protein [Spirochaetota bacterium]|nr:nucleotidyltransferase family protein [Spirochaetota bacterium]HNT11640.1 nucleotidyltransferase family protein [Spirochaetota bacterium]